MTTRPNLPDLTFTPLAAVLAAAAAVADDEGPADLARLRAALAELAAPDGIATEEEVDRATAAVRGLGHDVDPPGSALASRSPEGVFVSAWVWVPVEGDDGDVRDPNGKRGSRIEG